MQKWIVTGASHVRNTSTSLDKAQTPPANNHQNYLPSLLSNQMKGRGAKITATKNTIITLQEGGREGNDGEREKTEAENESEKLEMEATEKEGM